MTMLLSHRTIKYSTLRASTLGMLLLRCIQVAAELSALQGPTSSTLELNLGSLVENGKFSRFIQGGDQDKSRNASESNFPQPTNSLGIDSTVRLQPPRQLKNHLFSDHERNPGFYSSFCRGDLQSNLYSQAGSRDIPNVVPPGVPLSASYSWPAIRYFCGKLERFHNPPLKLEHVAERPGCFIAKIGHKTGWHLNDSMTRWLRGLGFPSKIFDRALDKSYSLHDGKTGGLQKLPHHERYPRLCHNSVMFQRVGTGAGIWNASLIEEMMSGPARDNVQVTFIREISRIAISSFLYHAKGAEKDQPRLMTPICTFLEAEREADNNIPRAWKAFAEPEERNLPWMKLSKLAEEFVHAFDARPSMVEDIQNARDIWPFRENPALALRRVALLQVAIRLTRTILAQYLYSVYACNASDPGPSFSSLYMALYSNLHHQSYVETDQTFQAVTHALQLELLRMMENQNGVAVNIGLVAASALSSANGPWIQLAGNGLLRDFYLDDAGLAHYTWLMGVNRPEMGQLANALSTSIKAFLHAPKRGTPSEGSSLRRFIDSIWARNIKVVLHHGFLPESVDLCYRTALLWDSLVLTARSEGLLDSP